METMSIDRNNKLPQPPKAKTGWPWTEQTNQNIYSKEISWPKISIVTPSFNQGQFIEETIRSVLLQNYPNLEYFIIDGGSTDNTVEIIQKYDPFLSGWVSEKDSGQSNAINKGIKMCTGEIFNWINSDDFMQPNALFNIAKAFLTKPDCSAIIGKVNILDIDKVVRVRPPSFVSDDLAESIGDFNLNQEGTYLTLEKLKATRNPPIDEELHYVMDLDFWLNILLSYGVDSVIKIDNIISNFRRHPDAKSTIQNDLGFLKSESKNEILAIMKYFAENSGNSKQKAVLEYFNAGNDFIKPRFVYNKSYSKSFYKKVLTHYFYKLFKRFYQSNEMMLAKKVSKGILITHLRKQHLRDYFYMKRRLSVSNK